MWRTARLVAAKDLSIEWRSRQVTNQVLPFAGLTLVLFDNEYLVPHAACPVEQVPQLDASTYVPRGSTAWEAAGKIHTDIQDGFVRAEVVGWEELADAGGYSGARDRGTLRTEGRDYVMQDGDVMTVNFTP